MLKVRIFDSISLGYLIIIALIVVLQPSEKAYLQLSWMGSMAFIALSLGFLISYGLSRFQIQSLGWIIFKPSRIKAKPTAWCKLFWKFQLALLFITTCAVGSLVAQISLYELTDIDGLSGMQRILVSLLKPDWSVLPQGIMAMIETVFIAFMATLFAVPWAFLLSFVCAKNIISSTFSGFSIYISLRAILNIIRSIEPLIWAIVFTVWVGIGPFAGVLGLMLHSIAALAKQYSELIECIENGPVEGIVATGAKPLQVLWFAVVPQILLPYISFTIYRWDINVRMATLVGIMGGGGIGTMLIQSMGLALWSEVSTLTIIIIAVVWSLDTASAYIREALK